MNELAGSQIETLREIDSINDDVFCFGNVMDFVNSENYNFDTYWNYLPSPFTRHKGYINDELHNVNLPEINFSDIYEMLENRLCDADWTDGLDEMEVDELIKKYGNEIDAYQYWYNSIIDQASELMLQANRIISEYLDKFDATYNFR